MVVKNYDELMSYGVGGMLWVTINGRRALLVRVPHEMGNVVIYPRRTDTNWSEAGEELGWDGNVEHPTFHPSVDCSKHGGWHGFIVRGQLCADPKGKQVQYP